MACSEVRRDFSKRLLLSEKLIGLKRYVGYQCNAFSEFESLCISLTSSTTNSTSYVIGTLDLILV